MNLTNLDLHMLRCLDALVDERHVSRAAARMNMSQSGMSTALGRLREIFQDPILIRTRNGMELSAEAVSIAGAARRAISEIEAIFSKREEFDPASSMASFSIMAGDYAGLTIIPKLIERLEVVAPGVSINIVAPDPLKVRETLTNGEIDLLIAFIEDLPNDFYQIVLVEDELCCLMRKEHNLANKSTISLEEYANARHAFYGSIPSFTAATEIYLERLTSHSGISRKVVARLPTLATMFRAIQFSDLVATMPKVLALSVTEAFNLTTAALPLSAPIKVRAVWHSRMHGNKAHSWLRNEIALIAKMQFNQCQPGIGT